MQTVLHLVQRINAYLGDYVLLILLIGTGLYFTLKTKFVQIRYFKEGMKSVFGSFSLKGEKQNNGMSSFQALATAIAAQVGTGNIVGASGAILLGGPGAIFWMWVIAFLGMATIYAEAVLAQKTRITERDGSILGGPVYYIQKAFPNRFSKLLAGFFSASAVISLGFMGAMVQSNSIGETCSSAFGIPAWIIGIVLCAICAVIMLGGVQRLASVTEKLVPMMAALYLIGSLLVLVMRAVYLPQTIGMIFKYAFAPNAIIGGSVGYALKTAISQGAKRGLFSNEAGMGSTPHAHAMANVKDPHEQGVVAMIGVFIDTFVVVTMTALVIISTLYADNGILCNGPIDTISKANMAQLAFDMCFGEKLGASFVAICLFFFAFSTILGWNLFGKVNYTYLFGKKTVLVYTVLALIFVFMGSCLSNDLVWELQDMFHQLIVLPNVVALIILSSYVVAEVKRHV